MSLTRIPALCDSARLAKIGIPGEPLVILKVSGVGSTGEHEMMDREGRVLRLKWSTPHGGHVLKIPLSLWQRNKHKLAHDIMDQPGSGHPLIVLIEGFDQSQGSQEVRQEAHNLRIEGSTPSPATTQDPQEEARKELVAEIIAGADSPPPTETITTLAGDVEPVAPPFESKEEEEDAAKFVADEIPLITEIKLRIASGNHRVSDLVDVIRDTDETMIREAIASEGSGLHIAGGGWVKLLEG